MTGTLSGGGRGSVLVSCGGVLRARYRRNNIMSVSRPPAIKTPSRVDGAVFRRVGEGGGGHLCRQYSIMGVIGEKMKKILVIRK